MHQCTMAGLCDPDWKVGLLCNVNIFPLDRNANSECIQLGLCMSWQDFFHIGLWGFMDNLVVMQPPKPMQIGLGWRSPKPVQAQRYHMVLQFCGDNSVAQTMVQEATKGTGSTTHTAHTPSTGPHSGSTWTSWR